MDDRSIDDSGTDDRVEGGSGAGGNPEVDESDPDSALHVATEGERWRFSLEDLDEEPGDRITPGSPSLEHAIFVLLGVAATGFVILQLLL